MNPPSDLDADRPDRMPTRRNLLIVGAGYVGLTAAAAFARLGHDVVCADIDRAVVTSLSAGIVPMREQGLDDAVRAGLEARRLRFVLDAAAFAQDREFVFVCVPTPLAAHGRTDVSAVLSVAASLGAVMAPDAVLVLKSTLPIGAADEVATALARHDVALVSNPEFLREGTALADFCGPDRIVIGADDARAAARTAALYAGIDAPVITTDHVSAQTVKYAANSFLAVKASFANALSAVCEAVHADVDAVLAGVCADHRIGAQYMSPGPGWGGSCLPKDTLALLDASSAGGYVFELLQGAIDANTAQIDRIVAKAARMAQRSVGDAGSGAQRSVGGAGSGAQRSVGDVGSGAQRSVGGAVRPGDLCGVRLALFGLTFKAGTDDLRGSPALELARRFAAAGASVRAYDPAIADRMAERSGVDAALRDAVELADCPVDAAHGAHVIVLATEWPQFAALDWSAIAAVMAAPRVVDARNLLDPAQMRATGFDYDALGRVQP